jgi:hypothetical protein
MDMHVHSGLDSQVTHPWNRGKLTGAKPPLSPKHVWAVRTRLQLLIRSRDLALFNRAEQCRATIEKDGVVIRARAGPPKDHPALKHELGFRSFTVRTLQKLGLDVEPIGRVGRPPGGFGIRGIPDGD